MTTEILKARAKHLRPAVAKMFKVTVTHSQSLELVAQEENYPSWDSACASYGQSGKIPTPRVLHPTQSVQVMVRRNKERSMATIFEENETIPLEMHRLMNLSDSRGGLVLICSTTSQGKSTTANVVMSDLLLANLNTSQRTMFIDSQTCLDLPLGQRLVLVDEIRTARMAFEVMALVQAGAKVVATMHANRGIVRLRALLRQFGIGEVFLDDLIAEGQILSIEQELVWPDVSMQIESSRERQEKMLRQHGVEDAEIKCLIDKGPHAVLGALLGECVPSKD